MIKATCRVLFFKLAKLKNIFVFLPPDIKIMLLRCLVICRLDYCNGLYACARFIFNISIHNHCNLLSYYKQCRFLSVEYCIRYKLYLLVYRILNNTALIYSKCMFHIYCLQHENVRSEMDDLIIYTNHHCT